MTGRLEVLDRIGRFLTEELGSDKVTQRADGIIIVAGETEAFAIQALMIEAPEGISPRDFGEELVRHIEGRSRTDEDAAG